MIIFMILAGLELAHYARAHLKVSQMAMTVADNAGRIMTGIDEANIYEVFAGADVLASSLDFGPNGRIVLSSLEDNGLAGSQKGQMIRWQRCSGELDIDPAYGEQGDGELDATLRNGLGHAGKRIKSAPNTAVMFVEVTYDYQPLVGDGFFELGQIRYESAFNVRGRQNQAISNTQNLTVLDCD
ncbi:MAG: pilus assembly protein [Novosphingobium sp.]|nr:pilus assembly protein [Novosphingobium sp.]